MAKSIIAIVAFVWCTTVWLAAPAAAPATQPRVVAHWRFDGAGESGELLPPGVAIVDLSGNGNDLRAYSSEAAPRFAATQPGEHLVLDFTEPARRPMPARDLFVRHDAAIAGTHDLNHDELPQWTIEAAICCRGAAGWDRRFQTFVGRDGYDLPATSPVDEDPLSNLGFKKRGDDNRVSIEARDAGGSYVTVRSKEPMTPDRWYLVVAVSDGQKLTLFVKSPDDRSYVEQGSAPFRGALFNGGGIWTIGRGCYANSPTEQWGGYIGEVRISAAALSPDQFIDWPRSGSDSSKATTRATPTTTLSDAGSAHYPPTPTTLIPGHDPTMILAGDTFHVFGTHNGIAHWRSNDMVNWEPLPPVFPAGTPAWAKTDISPRAGLWAPDVLFFNGKYHLYYACSTFGSQRSAIGLATNPTLDPSNAAYLWADQGKVIESSPGMPFNAIDPTVVLDADGKPWIAFGSWNQGIFLRRLDENSGKLPATDKAADHLAARPGRDALEAPSLFLRNGWYYLVVSYDFCCRGVNSTYKLVIGRSRQITGPYVDRDGKPMLEGHASLLLRSYGFTRGPGQSTFVRQGNCTWMVHHYYDARDNGIPRVQVREIYWDADGWPLAGEPLAEQRHDAEPVTADLNGQWDLLSDYGKQASRCLFDRDGSVRKDGQMIGRWTRTEDQLQIRWSPDQSNAGGATADCFISTDGESFVGRRSSDGAIISGCRVDEMPVTP